MENIKIIDEYKVIEYDKCNIYVIENLLEEDFCNKIIDLIETIPLKKIVHGDFANVECFIAYTNELLQKNDNFYYDFSTQINNKEFCSVSNKKSKINMNNCLNGITNKELQNYIDNISEKVKIISNIMKQINPRICFDYNSGYNLRKIYGRTKFHIDGILDVIKSDVTFVNKSQTKDNYKMVRNASMIFALNDNYDGGEFHFPYHDIYLKMKKGSVIIFPPYWTHPHEVSSVENNTYRYTINTWFLEMLQN